MKILKAFLYYLSIFLCLLLSGTSKVEASTLYWYNNGVTDTEWNTLGNWWADINHTTPASNIPSSIDDVLTLGTIGPNVDLDLWPEEPNSIDAQLTGVVFSGTSGCITKNLIGNAIFNNGACNYGEITGNVTFNDSSSNQSTIIGDVIFNDDSYNDPGVITGNVTFNGASYNYGEITGNVTLNDTSINYYHIIGDTIFNNGSSNDGQISGGIITFNDNSENTHSIIGNPVFNDASINSSHITGNPLFNNNSNQYGLVTGIATFNDTSYNSELIEGGAIFNDDSTNEYDIEGDVIFNNNSSNQYGIITGSVTFNDTSYNDGTLAGDPIFNGDYTENNGSVTGIKTRYYNTNISITRDFIQDGPWTVIADGAIVNIYNATYDEDVESPTYTTFETLHDGIFVLTDTYEIPSITTDEATSITNTTAILNGTITNNGGEDVITGFEYGTEEGVYGDPIELADTYTTDESFLTELTNLTCATTYYFRARATNSADTGYGEEASFNTSECPRIHSHVSGSSAGAIARFKAEQQQLITPVISPTTPVIQQPITTRILKLKMTGDDVKTLQVYLNSHGFPVALTGAGSKGNETNFFGPKTKLAVILFQKTNGLTPDGIVGPKTREKMQ